MRILIGFFLLATVSLFSSEKPTVLLFNCHFGSGHKMATIAIEESLQDAYHIQVVDIYDGPLASIDPLGALIPQLSQEEIHNDLSKKEHNKFLNFTGSITPTLITIIEPYLEYLLENYLANNKPDLIICCAPIINSPLLKAAKKHHIPLLIITTDINVAAFCHGIKNIGIDRDQFRLTLPYAKEASQASEYSQELQDAFQDHFGYPTRASFSQDFSEEILEELRRQYQIQDNENVILVMMGGCTGESARVYAQILLSRSDAEIKKIVGLDNPRQKIRLLCLCGDITQAANYKLMQDLNNMNIRQNPHVHIHACPGTSKIAELVSLPELKTVISKPGGSSVNEMIKKRVPMVYHIAKVPLFWEKGNIDYGIAHNLGLSFCPHTDRSEELVDILSYTFCLKQSFLEDSALIPEAQIDFSANLREAVHQMLENNFSTRDRFAPGS